MIGLRRAIAWASAGHYLGMAISFASILILARLLTPAEYGVVFLATSIISLAEAVREVAGTGYLVREHELTTGKVRSTMTLSALVTVLLSAVVLAAAEPLALFFAMPTLPSYLAVALIGYAFGPLVHPPMALLMRNFAFNTVAVINIVATFVGAAVAIGLALLGFSSLSLAWSGVAALAVMTFLCLLLSRDRSIYRPSLEHWRSVLAFGSHSSATAILGKINETLPVFIVGKVLSADALAIGQRAFVLSLIPDRIVFAAVGAVVLPELSRRARQGDDLQAAYLGAIAYITVVQWPAMILVAILAEPLVQVLLGTQWLEAAPIVRILTPALMFAVPVGLQYATLVSAGHVHRLPRLLVMQALLLAAVLLVAAPHGLRAVAWSAWVAMPASTALSLMTVRSALGFRWRDLWTVVGRTTFVTMASAALPLAITSQLAVSGLPGMLGVMVASLAAAAVMWGIAIYVIGHPVEAELRLLWTTAMRQISRLRPAASDRGAVD